MKISKISEHNYKQFSLSMSTMFFLPSVSNKLLNSLLQCTIKCFWQIKRAKFYFDGLDSTKHLTFYDLWHKSKLLPSTGVCEKTVWYLFINEHYDVQLASDSFYYVTAQSIAQSDFTIREAIVESFRGVPVRATSEVCKHVVFVKGPRRLCSVLSTH